MKSELPNDPEVLHDHEVWEASLTSIVLPSESVKARHLLVGREERGGVKSFYYHLIFDEGIFMKIYEFFDAGPLASAGAMEVLIGRLTLPAGAPAAPKTGPFLAKDLIKILDFVKKSINTADVSGAKGEVRIAADCQVRVKKGTPVDVHYHTKTTAEEAAEAAACSRSTTSC
jgi:hypothetical protein